MSLRDEIAHRLCALLDDDWSLGKRLYQSEADAIIALVRAHLTSDEPVAWAYVNPDGECEQIEWGRVYDDPHVIPLYASPPAPESE